MAWLLEITENGRDIYPELRKAGERKLKTWLKAKKEDKSSNMIRVAMMKHFGYYVTESSEHNAEYAPFWIKRNYPELIDDWNIPLDEYPRRCILQIKDWKETYAKLKEDVSGLELKRSAEYGSGIMDAIYTNTPYQIGGNVLNRGLITNLPADAVVEVPCLVDGSGIQGTYVGELPTQCAAMNMTNINVQLLTIEAALTLKRERIYQAAMLDPHTAAELSIDDIVHMCDDLIAAHGDMLPKYN
jgi:alpha-galactosidase